MLYYDTDSIIYIQPPGAPELNVGVYLGEWKNKLESYGPDAYIKEYCAGGPKCYGYNIINPANNKTKTVV